MITSILLLQSPFDTLASLGRQFLRLSRSQIFLVFMCGVSEKTKLFSVAPAPFANQQV